MKLILENWKKFLNESKLRVFDFDDTLVATDSMVYLTLPDGSEKEITPAEFATYQLKDGESFDEDPESANFAYREFGQIKNPKEVPFVMNILKSVVKKEMQDPEDRKIVILTARAHNARIPILTFLEYVLGTSAAEKVEVHTLGDKDPNAKSGWIEAEIMQGATDIEFFDDSGPNVEAVAALKQKYPEVRLRSRRIIKRGEG